jgi:SET domain-containing protein
MLLVPTFLVPSKIHGLGLHTSVAIPKGQPVWKLNLYFCDRIVPDPADVKEPLASFIRKYCYFDRRRKEWVLCGDDARFLNHVPLKYNKVLKTYSGPTLRPPVIEADYDHWMHVALRDIPKDEELTCDYGTFDARFNSGQKFKEPEPPVIVAPPDPPDRRKGHEISAS